jgi:uncharacterized protein YdaU (DUF1376 family)
MWLEGGKLPMDEDMLCNITGGSKDDLKVVIGCFTVDEHGFFIQKRMQVEIDKQREHRANKKKAAEIRWENVREQDSKEPKAVRIAKAATKFRETLNSYYKKHPKKYPMEMYKEFFDYWGIPENKTNPEKLVMERQQSWNLGRRLGTWYARTDKGKVEPDVKIKINTKPVNMDD